MDVRDLTLKIEVAEDAPKWLKRGAIIGLREGRKTKVYRIVKRRKNKLWVKEDAPED